jgi:hypothetical protein
MDDQMTEALSQKTTLRFTWHHRNGNNTPSCAQPLDAATLTDESLTAAVALIHWTIPNNGLLDSALRYPKKEANVEMWYKLYHQVVTVSERSAPMA